MNEIYLNNHEKNVSVFILRFYGKNFSKTIHNFLQFLIKSNAFSTLISNIDNRGFNIISLLVCLLHIKHYLELLTRIKKSHETMKLDFRNTLLTD